MRVAFALSGGGARAAAQLGVLRALAEANVTPDFLVGASAGAVNGTWYALHPENLDDLEGVWHGLSRQRVFPGTPAHFAYNFLRYGHAHRIDSWGAILATHFGLSRFEDAKIPLTTLTVQLSDGGIRQWEKGLVLPVLKASTAVPGLFPPQMLDGELHVDGAVVEFLPVPTAVAKGATRIYALDCSDFPSQSFSRATAIDRSGQIASTAWVRMVIEDARRQGVEVIHLRPPLGDLHDGRDFQQTKRLIRDGFTYATTRLSETAVT